MCSIKHPTASHSPRCSMLHLITSHRQISQYTSVSFHTEHQLTITSQLTTAHTVTIKPLSLAAAHKVHHHPTDHHYNTVHQYPTRLTVTSHNLQWPNIGNHHPHSSPSSHPLYKPPMRPADCHPVVHQKPHTVRHHITAHHYAHFSLPTVQQHPTVHLYPI
jgi:hypothetical protein